MSRGRFRKKTIRDVEAEGRRTLVRVDFNVPLEHDRNGPSVADDSRIRAALPTIEYLRDQAARVILVSHLGRPRDREPELSMAPVSARLAELTDADVSQAPAVVGEEIEAATEELRPRAVLVLENCRFEPGETRNEPELARALARLADLYVNDAFGTAHRAHATTVGVAELLPAAAGFLFEREVEVLTALMEDPERPFVVILGGSKVSDKIGVIERFLDIADAILIGGAMCFSFFRAQGKPTGDSLVEEAGVSLAQRILERANSSRCRLELPVDLVIADRFDAGANRRGVDGTEVPDGWWGLDVGPKTCAAYAAEIAAARTVFWNGPLGAFELDPFAAGTRAVAEALARTDATTVVGGGDSVAALERFGLTGSVSHVSTGGGASLRLLEGEPLPALEALDDA